MNPFVISGIPKIIFGSGTIRELPKTARSYGKNVLLITGGSSLKENGTLDGIIESCKANGISIDIESVKGEPSPDVIDDISSIYRKKTIHVVAAIGGGSVIDTGKAVSAMLAETGSVYDFLESVGTKKPSGYKSPFIAIPTTSGTGSEATKNAVISSVGKNGFKKSLRHDAYMPDCAIIDPDLTMTLPKNISIACGMDAISQLIESYISTKANPFTDSLALSGLKAAFLSFPVFLKNSKLESIHYQNMSYASLLSGITLSHAGLGAVHGLAGPLGGLFPIPHGIACGSLLSAIMSHTVDRLHQSNDLTYLSKFSQLGILLGGKETGSVYENAAFFSTVLTEWNLQSAFPSFGSFGITDGDIFPISSLYENKNSPVSFTNDDIAAIVREKL